MFENCALLEDFDHPAIGAGIHAAETANRLGDPPALPV
jgi:hypothetical protein